MTEKLKVALIGPICKDEIIIKGKSFFQLGGPVYYTGHALSCLNAEVNVFAAFGKEKKDWLKGFKYDKLIHIKSEKTIKYINEYPDENNPDIRVQRAEIPENVFKPEDFKNHDLNKFDFIVVAPSYHNNFPMDTIKEISKSKAKKILAAQGIARHLEGEQVVLKHPEKVIKVLPYFDYLITDEQELSFITQKEPVFERAYYLQTKGVHNLVVTNASKGSVIFLEDRIYPVKAFPPKNLKDPTGAGDTYLAGFIKAQELFDNPVKQGEFAAMVATIGLENQGPFNKTLDDVYERLKHV